MAYGIINADQIQSSVPNVSLGAGNSSLLKNKIINGAMVISQRNGTNAVTPTNADYTLDRWQYSATQASKFTVQQGSGSLSVLANTGFNNYLYNSVAATVAPAAGDLFTQRQQIEGFNISDLQWGTANAKPVTLSFWVYTNVTGTQSGSISNGAGNRCYVFSYSVTSSATWTQVSVTIPGDTTGTWATDNSSGMIVRFNLGAGSTYLGAAGSWGSTLYVGATGSQQVVSVSGGICHFTGVQLEVGSSATGYEYRLYNQELAACQRYALPVLGSFTGFTNGTTVIDCSMTFPVPMRAAPIAGSSSAAVALCVTAGGATSTQSALSFTFPSAGVVTQFGASVRFSNFTGLTSGQAAYVYTNATTPAGFLTAEL